MKECPTLLLFAIKSMFVFVSKCPYLSQCYATPCNVM